ncbi:alanine racemase [Methylophilaceae bacterium]|nr:alanine racemase [Methylophilaceae bacterium]
MRPIQATIHLGALRHNLEVAKSHAPQSRAMAVVKANGYGHGLLRIAQGLDDADGFAVLGLNEAIGLREAGFNQAILLLEGVFHERELAGAAQDDISLVVHHLEQVRMLEQAFMDTPVSVFIKMNTGMNRLGFRPEHYAGAVSRLAACRNVAQIALMTHFATADDSLGVAGPLAIFNQATRGMAYPVSLANSAAILRYPETHTDWVRPGIMLYGASPVAGTPAKAYGLRPAMSLASAVIAIQNLQAGDSVGYGHRFTASRPTRVGIVACGYADGYPRHAPSGTPVAVAGRMTQTLGRVSMDMLFVDITDIPEAVVGSAVELWGEHVPVDAVAEISGTVGYELLCALAARVPVKVVS